MYLSYPRAFLAASLVFSAAIADTFPGLPPCAVTETTSLIQGRGCKPGDFSCVCNDLCDWLTFDTEAFNACNAYDYSDAMSWANNECDNLNIDPLQDIPYTTICSGAALTGDFATYTSIYNAPDATTAATTGADTIATRTATSTTTPTSTPKSSEATPNKAGGVAGLAIVAAMIPSLAPLAVSILLFGSFNVAFAQQENDPGHTTAPYYPDNPICYQKSWLFVDVISNCNQFGMQCVCSDVKTWYEFVYYAYQACDSTDGDTAVLWGYVWCDDQGYECSSNNARYTDLAHAEAYLSKNGINTATPTTAAATAAAPSATDAGCDPGTGLPTAYAVPTALSSLLSGFTAATATATPTAESKSGAGRAISGGFAGMAVLGAGVVAFG